MIFLQETFNLDSKIKKTQKLHYVRARTKILESIKSKSFGFIQDLYNKDFSIISEFSVAIKGSINLLSKRYRHL